MSGLSLGLGLGLNYTRNAGGGLPPGFVYALSPVTGERLLSPVTGQYIIKEA